jgi:hypothetical protein
MRPPPPLKKMGAQEGGITTAIGEEKENKQNTTSRQPSDSNPRN